MDGADTQSAADMLFARRASSFGSQAVAYAEHRPNYPLTGIRWVVEAARRPVRRVLDLAAGTGKLTEGLLALGLEVIAVEPNAEMLAELPRRCPDAPALSGTAERIPLAGETVDAVLVGQAFHWFDNYEFAHRGKYTEYPQQFTKEEECLWCLSLCFPSWG